MGTSQQDANENGQVTEPLTDTVSKLRAGNVQMAAAIRELHDVAKEQSEAGNISVGFRIEAALERLTSAILHGTDLILDAVLQVRRDADDAINAGEPPAAPGPTV